MVAHAHEVRPSLPGLREDRDRLAVPTRSGQYAALEQGPALTAEVVPRLQVELGLRGVRRELQIQFADLEVATRLRQVRALGNRALALLKGQRVPIAGVVTMDMTMLDVTDHPCTVGDVVTFIGRDGSTELTVADVAATASPPLSPYELLVGLRMRLPRVYSSPGS
mgnify:CR=1 FL=1